LRELTCENLLARTCLQELACENLLGRTCLRELAWENLLARTCLRELACENLLARTFLRELACENSLARTCLRELACENLLARTCLRELACENLLARTFLRELACENSLARTRLRELACKNSLARTRLQEHAYENSLARTRLRELACENSLLRTHFRVLAFKNSLLDLNVSTLYIQYNKFDHFRLQHSLQNSCDIPKPVVGITSGVYSNEGMDNDQILNRCLLALAQFQTHLANFSLFNGSEGHPCQMLHLTLEAFQNSLESRKLMKKCLISDNPQAAAKLSLLSGNTMQAFDFTMQAYIKSGLVGQDIFEAFLYFLHFKQDSTKTTEANVEAKRQLLERLIACWQDQKFSFVQLERLFLQVREKSQKSHKSQKSQNLKVYCWEKGLSLRVCFKHLRILNFAPHLLIVKIPRPLLP
jgi:hypothetical protein